MLRVVVAHCFLCQFIAGLHRAHHFFKPSFTKRFGFGRVTVTVSPLKCYVGCRVRPSAPWMGALAMWANKTLLTRAGSNWLPFYTCVRVVIHPDQPASLL